MEDVIIWDAAHLLELVCDDGKNGKKDHRGNVIFHPTSWLQDLDSILRFIMTKFTTGENHSHLQETYYMKRSYDMRLTQIQKRKVNA